MIYAFKYSMYDYTILNILHLNHYTEKIIYNIIQSVFSFTKLSTQTVWKRSSVLSSQSRSNIAFYEFLNKGRMRQPLFQSLIADQRNFRDKYLQNGEEN